MATKRPLTVPLALTFLLFFAGAAWKMRIQTALNNVAAGLASSVAQQKHVNVNDHHPLRTHWTGLAPLDGALAFLIAAFMPGLAAWDEKFHVQQAYFLPQFFAVLAVLTVEAHRRRNDGKVVGFTNFFAAVYQFIGGAVIVPLWYALHVVASSRSDYHLPSNRQVRPAEARALMPALVIGYVVPTVLMWAPWLDRTDVAWLEVLNAVWQFSPLAPNFLVHLFGGARDQRALSAEQKRAAHWHVLSVYVVAGLYCAATHAWFVYSVLTSTNPEVSFASVLVPGGLADALVDDASGLLWIFQWDFWGIFLATFLWCFVGLVDVSRFGGASVGAVRALVWTVWVSVISVVAGPGTAISVASYWNEASMFELEEKKRANE